MPGGPQTELELHSSISCQPSHHPLLYDKDCLSLCEPLVPCSCGDLISLGARASFPSFPFPRAALVKAFSVTHSYIVGLMEGQSGGLLFSGGDARSAWLRDLAGTFISSRHNRWCAGFVESEQASLSTTEMTRQ